LCTFVRTYARGIFVVYKQRGYMDLVARAAETSMRSAIEEVQSLPHYAQEGEVRKCMHVHVLTIAHLLITASGSLPTRGTTPLPMHTTLLCLASLEGNLVIYPMCNILVLVV
jgi:hypothetical protein